MYISVTYRERSTTVCALMVVRACLRLVHSFPTPLPLARPLIYDTRDITSDITGGDYLGVPLVLCSIIPVFATPVSHRSREKPPVSVRVEILRLKNWAYSSIWVINTYLQTQESDYHLLSKAHSQLSSISYGSSPLLTILRTYQSMNDLITMITCNDQ